jgi:hypothetical protein
MFLADLNLRRRRLDLDFRLQLNWHVEVGQEHRVTTTRPGSDAVGRTDTELRVRANTDNWGGEDNSITPGNIPWFSTQIWWADFSDTTTVSKTDQGTFIHEFVHVWQYYHHITKLSAITLYAWYRGDYDPKAYNYDLSDYDDFTDFNIEQQASIVEDFWRINEGLSPLRNVGTDKAETTYYRFVEQMRGAGPPTPHPTTTACLDDEGRSGTGNSVGAPAELPGSAARASHQSSTEPSSLSYSSAFFQSWLILSARACSSSSMPSPGPAGRSR